jgi:hypothetical protein
VSFILDPYRFAVAASSPWITGQVTQSGDREVMVSPDGTNWTTAPTYASGLTSNIAQLQYADGLVLASAGSGVRYSLDGGQTWGATSGLGSTNLNGTITKSGSFWIISATPTNEIYRSSDGIAWTAGPTRTFYDCLVFNSSVIVGSTNSTYQRSTDDGDTWTNTSVGATMGPIRHIAASSTHIVATTTTSRAFVRRSSTGASGSWASVTVAGSGFSTNGIAASPAGDFVLLASNRQTYYSTDHGATWTAGAVIGAADDVPTSGINCVSYGDGAWMITTRDNGTQTARIWRATNPAGPWTEVGTYSPAAALGGVRYIGP